MGRISLALITLLLTSQAVAEDVIVEATSSLEPVSSATLVEKKGVKEILDSFSGVNLISLSSAPTPRDVVFLRGFTPERFYVYYGEVPLNGSGIRGNFYFDLSSLPHFVRKVKVVYGPSVVYGSNPGGNIILEPEGFPVNKEFSFSVSAGSYNTYKSSLKVSLPAGLTGVRLSFQGLSSKGYLRNDSSKTESLEIGLFRFIGDSSVLKFTTFLSRVRDGFPVLNTPKVEASNYDDNYPKVEVTYFSLACAPYCKMKLIDRDDDNYLIRQVERYSLDLLTQTDKGEFDFTLYFNRAKKWEDYYGFFKTPKGVKLTSMKLEGTDDFTYGFRTLYSQKLFKLGAEFNSSGYGSIEKNGKELTNSNLHALRRGALFAEVERELLGLKLRGGFRVERWLGRGTSGDTEFLPAISLFKGVGENTFYFGVGRVYRPPKAEELKWYSAGRTLLKRLGYNYKLKDEEGWDLEAGVRNKNLSVRFFDYRIKNYIVSNFLAAQKVLHRSFPYRVIENLSWVKNRGVEVSYQRNLGSYSYLLSYTYQNFSHSSSSFTPSETPSPKVLVPKSKLVLSLRRGNFLLNKDWAEVEMKAYSKRSGVSGKVPGFTVFSFSYGLKPFKGLDLSIKIDNVFDRKYYFVEGYRMPGRNFSVNLTYAFGER
ncbi:MAG: hypothetical protein ABGX17_06480 [Desulfurobacteriaceae bacterium]